MCGPHYCLRRDASAPNLAILLAITTTFEHIGHWIMMRQSLARFSEPESSPQIRSWADFVVTTSEFKFSVHTGAFVPAIAPQPGNEIWRDEILRCPTEF